MLVAAGFTINGGQPATGLTLSEIEITLYAVNKSTLAQTLLWNAVNPTAEVTGQGVYLRVYSGEDLDTFYYFATAEYTGATALDTNYATGIVGENLSAAAVWSYAERTLSVPSAIVNESAAGNAVNVYRGTTWSIAFSGLGDLSDYTNFWFTVKDNNEDVDARALVHISQDVGLEVINRGVAATPANGSIVDTDGSGTVTVTLDESESALLLPGRRLSYDLKGRTSGGAVYVLVDGRSLFTILPDVSRATS